MIPSATSSTVGRARFPLADMPTLKDVADAVFAL